jgi:hypothetical protein
METKFRRFIILPILLILFSCGVQKDYEEAKESQSVVLYEKYIQKHPKSKYLEQAKLEVHELHIKHAWRTTQLNHTIEDYYSFLRKFPNTKHEDTANRQILILKEQRDWQYAKNKNSILGYQNFIDKYPGSTFVDDAKERIKAIQDIEAWKKAKSINTAQSYKTYLEQFPDGDYISSARQEIKEIEVIVPQWQAAKHLNTIDAYEEFLKAQPYSSYSNAARAKIKILKSQEWETAKNGKSIKVLKDYLQNNPNSEHISEAETLIIDLEVDAIFKGDHGKLPPMDKDNQGSDYSHENNISIYNNTSFTLTLRYSGSESKKVVLSPQGRKSIILENGAYRVAASVNASNISNYAGKENLIGGKYTSEYYIATTTTYH